MVRWSSALKSNSLKKKNKEAKFTYERKMCNETKYADVYFTA